MSLWAAWGLSFLFSVTLLVLYIRVNNKRLSTIPKEALTFSPQRWTPESIRSHAAQLAQSPLISNQQIPPKTGRRYIVVGGVRLIQLIVAFPLTLLN